MALTTLRSPGAPDIRLAVDLSGGKEPVGWWREPSAVSLLECLSAAASKAAGVSACLPVRVSRAGVPLCFLRSQHRARLKPAGSAAALTPADAVVEEVSDEALPSGLQVLQRATAVCSCRV